MEVKNERDRYLNSAKEAEDFAASAKDERTQALWLSIAERYRRLAWRFNASLLSEVTTGNASSTDIQSWDGNAAH
jgi:hypothetical protein